jgi:hypothetical protein
MYHWNVYQVYLNSEFRGYVFAQDEKDAKRAWNAPADRFEPMEEAEFYVTSEEEGGHVIFLAPDDLVDHLIEAEHVNEPHVLYVKN